VISFLENHIGITDVEFAERTGKVIIDETHIMILGVAETSITKWEEENAPY
jgi:hypothetical protein